jgi:hypothetical protein
MTTTDLWDTLRRVCQQLSVIEDELLDGRVECDDVAAQIGDLSQTLEDLMERLEVTP